MEGHMHLELWMTLADQRLPKTTLTKLCLVSKTLNDIFRPALYRDIVLAHAADDPLLSKKYIQLSQICGLPTESHLRHTRCLDVNYIGTVAKMDLKKCFEGMPNLSICPLYTAPGSAGYFPTWHFSDVYLDHRDEGFYFQFGRLYQWPKIPAYRNLRSLDLRRISGANLRETWLNIAGILFNDGAPTITALGLDMDLQLLRFQGTDKDLLVNVVTEFDELRRAADVPNLRLNLQDLILGQGVFNSTFYRPQGQHREDQLSRITDLSKLRTLRVLNHPRHPETLWPSWMMTINVRMLDEATAIEKLCVESCDGEVMRLLMTLGTAENSRNKSTLRDFQATLVTDWIHFDSILGGCYKWRQILFGGLDLHNDLSEYFSGQCMGSCGLPFDLEELGISFLHWDLYKSYLLQFTNLRILMCENTPHSRENNVLGKDILARRIFRKYQNHAKQQGRISKLRYVGIGGSIYTCLWLPPFASSASSAKKDDFELHQLDQDEVRTFDFIKMTEKVVLGKYRLNEN